MALLTAGAGIAAAQPRLTILLPERTRLLEDQRVDLVIEMRNVTQASGLEVTANGASLTSKFSAPKAVQLDCDATPDMMVRADMVGFAPGSIRIRARVSTDAGVLEDVKDIIVYPFAGLPSQRRNVILFIGDAMGTAYRDAARIVGRSVETVPGVSGFREGIFDNLLEMDKMPASGMVMTYSSDRVVPDSANTASAWSTGNKTFTSGMGGFEDGTDCRWRLGGVNAANYDSLIDNPKVETLWEYLKRRFNYRTGVVSTAYLCDATPAGEGSHVASRQTRFEVARQYFENPFLGGKPVYDVALGGGWDEFHPSARPDKRDLVAEFQSAGYTFVSNASDLRSVSNASTSKLLGFFRRSATPAAASDGLRPNADQNMNVAYDKLHLQRPGSEQEPDFGGYPDQPFLDLMTQRAIEVLSGPVGDQPFILMVEGASIDKQSHPNNAAGTIWDTLELDKSIGVARRFAAGRHQPDTLVVVTADHDQSMSILGTVSVEDSDYFGRTLAYTVSSTAGIGKQETKVFGDVNTNVRAGYPFSGDNDPNSTGPFGPPASSAVPGAAGLGLGKQGAADFPDYIDADGDGYPENRTVGVKGRNRISVGFRTGSHTGSSVPVTAEGPGAFLFSGYMDQTDVFFKMAVSVRGDTSEGDQLQQLLRSDRYPQPFGIR